VTEIRIRQDHQQGYEIDLAQAIAYVRDGRDEDGDRVCRVVITEVYTEDTDGGLDCNRRPILHKAGEYVFGRQVEIGAREVRFGRSADATISWASSGQQTPAEAKVYAEMVTLAATIAEAANKAAAKAVEQDA
jgi:hypothetical protein